MTRAFLDPQQAIVLTVRSPDRCRRDWGRAIGKRIKPVIFAGFEIIFEAVRKNGCYVGDVPNREKFSKKIMDMRDYILSHGGRQKLYQ